MSFYLFIDGQQQPFFFDIDENKRQLYSVNFLSKIRDTTALHEQEIAQRLDDEGVGVRNTTIFLGALVTLPVTGGPYIRVIATQGLAPTRTHGGIDAAKTSTYGCQIIITGTLDGAPPQVKSNEVYTALDGLTNTELATA